MSKWSEFYQKRINSTYQEYFNKRYAPFLHVIKQCSNLFVKEEGCGIGSVIKALPNRYFVGTDLCPEMLELARLNNSNSTYFIQQDIITGESIGTPVLPIWYNQITTVVSHGVIEHFDDDTIVKIINRQKKYYENVIHYVPLQGYEKPSFGDERLLPLEHWIELVDPVYYEKFNDHDLIFVV